MSGFILVASRIAWLSSCKQGEKGLQGVGDGYRIVVDLFAGMNRDSMLDVRLDNAILLGFILNPH